MTEYKVIRSRRSVILLNVEDKIIGKIPTESNWAVPNTDNHIHLGTPGSNSTLENYIKDVVGLDVIEFKNNHVYDMQCYGVSEKVFTSLSDQGHIQLLIEENGKRSGLKEIITRYMAGNGLKNFDNYAIFFDFKKNEIFISKIKISGEFATLVNDNKSSNEEKLRENTLKTLQNAINNSNKITDVEKRNAYIEAVMLTRSSSFQKIYRNKLLVEFGCKCAICDINIKDLLIASHIVAYTDCKNNEERIDNNNGLLLCPLHDSLFDKGYISFDETGKVVLPPNSLIRHDILKELMGVDSNTKIEDKYLTKERVSYLKRHKRKF